jgi:hypothetical protein
MPEHHTKSTISATYWCGKCKRHTQWSVHDGRKGACLRCIAGIKVEVKVKFEAVTIGPMCGCLAFRYPHEALAHFDLLTTMERKGWTIWTIAGNDSVSWPGWSELGSGIRYRRGMA